MGSQFFDDWGSILFFDLYKKEIQIKYRIINKNCSQFQSPKQVLNKNMYKKYQTDLMQVILEGIIQGTYPCGSPLPSIRELAEEFKVKRNLVYVVYKKLEEYGYIYSLKGKGFFVADKLPSTESLNNTLDRYIKLLIWSAQLNGWSKEQLLKKVFEYIEKGYNELALKVAFLECNSYEAKDIADEIERQIGLRVVPFVIGDLRTRKYARSYDIILTTLFHIQEVKKLFPGKEVIGLHHIPSSESVEQIAGIDNIKTIGVICTNYRTLETINSLVSLYHKNIKFAVTMDSIHLVRDVITKCDAIVVNPEAYEHLSSFVSKDKFVVIKFKIEANSMERLKHRISEAKNINRINFDNGEDFNYGRKL